MAALPRTLAARLALAGIAAAVLLAAVGILATAFRRETRTTRENREFRELLDRLASPMISEASLAVAGLPDQKGLLSMPERLGEAAALFSGESLRSAPTSGRLDVARSFWHGVMVLGDPAGRKLMPRELARLRRAYLVASARDEKPDELDRLPEGDGGPRVRAAMRDLIDGVFRSPAPPREELGALLWDRANLEEMAGLPLEALESWRFLEYDRVRSHWELDGRTTYLLRKADLLGRILRRFSQEPQGKDRPPEDVPGFKSDPELSAFRAEEGGAMAHLLDGLELAHRGEHLAAVDAFDGYLRSGGGNAEETAAIETRPRQLALYLRAASRRVAAGAAFRAAEGFRAPPPLLGALARGGLDLRRARLLAALRQRDEFEAVRAELSRANRENGSLLAALSEAVWDDRERGAAEVKRLTAARADIPDGEAWVEVSRGILPPAPRTLFEVGQLSDELGDMPRLSRTISRLEFAIETGADEAYLAFLRAVLRLRRGQVVEAWADLERLLDRPEFPPGLDRRTIARFMEGAEEAADFLTRARSLARSAEKDLSVLWDRQKEIDPSLALMASVDLWTTRTEGEAIDPDRAGDRREVAPDLLADLRAAIDSDDPPSYDMDRVWVGLRNAMGRSYRELWRSGQVDAALERLAEFDSLLGKGAHRELLGEEAALRRDRATSKEAAGDQEGALSDLRRAGQLFLEAAEGWDLAGAAAAAGVEDPAGAARSEAAHAFERVGDLEGVVRALAPVGRSSRDPALLLRWGKALLGRGELEKARNILWRVLSQGEDVDQVVEEPGDPVRLGGCHFQEPPPDLTAWLELYSFIDPLNGTGMGRLRYEAARRTLQWKAPGESRFGRPIYLTEGEMSRVPSGDDPRKTILVAPRRGIRSQLLPRSNGEWAVEVVFREASVDPVQLEARLSLAEAVLRLARLSRFASDASARPFIERQLGGGGSARVRSSLHLLAERALEDLYKDPASAAALQGELGRAVSSWRAWAEEEKTAAGGSSRGRLDWFRELDGELAELASSTGDPVKVRAVLKRDIPQIHERLRGFYGAAIHILLSKEGPSGPVRATLEELARDLLDQEAREGLLFLCENVGNRSSIWKRAMALRGLQAESRAGEAARAAGDRAVLGPPPDPAALTAEARDIYDRLLRVAVLEDGPGWVGRALLSLSRIEASAGKLREARTWLYRLADADLEGLGKRLLPEDRAYLSGLARSASFMGADLARRAGDTPEAIRRYTEAIQRHGGSPLALWAHLELGSCYEAQGLPEDAYREYRKGKLLLSGELSTPSALDHWFEGDRGRIVEAIRGMYPRDEAEKAIAPLEKGSSSAGRDFWNKLFDEKLKALPRQ